MKPTPSIQSDIALDRSRFADYMSLTKPELTFLSVLTALAGYILGSDGVIVPVNLAVSLLGIALIGAGAGALNQFLERRWDALMRRTEHRPLPSGRITPAEALVFGVTTSVVGLALLALDAGPLTATLGALTLVTYLFLYTPLKRVTPWATIVGAVPGALPPVMGWTAAGNSINLTAGVVFGILFAWQVPHFLSLAWMYRLDYAQAGYRLLPRFDSDGSLAAKESLAFMGILMLVIGLPCLTGFFGLIYMGGAFVITSLFVVTGWIHLLERSNKSARLMFVASLIYIPTLMGLMVIDRLLLPA